MGRRAAAAARRRPGRRHPHDRRHRAGHPRAAGRLQRAVRRSRAGASTWPTPRPWSSRATRSAWRGRSTKIAADPRPLRHANRATAHLYIANPLQEDQGSRRGVFDTHPPIQQRIAVLLEMAHVGPEALARGGRAGRRGSRRPPASRRRRPPPAAPPLRRVAAAGVPRAAAAASRPRAPLAAALSRRRRGLPVGLAGGLQGAGQPQVGPRLVPAPQRRRQRAERVVGVVVVGHVGDDVAEALGRLLVAARERTRRGRAPRGWSSCRARGAGPARGTWRPGRDAVSRGRRRRAGRACRPRSRPRKPGSRRVGRRPRAAPSEAELGRDALHRLEPEGEELVELEAELLAARDGLAVDAARERALADSACAPT